MSIETKYNIVSTGNIKAGFEPKDVESAFAALFKLTAEKAAAVLNGKNTIKKDVGQEMANRFKQRLESIGLEIELVQQGFNISELSLEPVEEPKPEPALKVESPIVTNNFNEVSTSKYSNAQSTNKPKPIPEVIGNYEELNVKSIGAAALAAIVGAFVWKIIAVTFNYELSLIAWGIGGAVGFAASKMGSKGLVSGVMCGVFALFAIIGGKYMTTEAFTIDFVEELRTTYQPEMREAYAEQLEFAEIYVDTVTDDASLKQFIVDYDYDMDYDLGALNASDIAYFKENVEPELIAMAGGGMSFDTWFDTVFSTMIGEASTMDIVIDELGLLDFLFLFFGIGTAFRLGRGGM